MAKLMHCGNHQGPVNSGEERLLKYLEVNLPDDYLILSNIELAYLNPKNHQVQYLEYDCIIVAPHAIFNIENKDFSGRLEGDDNYWYLNDRETRNPHKTLRFKTSVLASKLKEKNASWSKAWIQSIVSLSHPYQTKKGLWGAHIKATYILDQQFIDNLTQPELIGREKNELISIYQDIAAEICGTASLKTANKKTEVEGYQIIDILDQEPNYTEYLVKPKGVTSAIRKRIREYALDVPNLPLAQREKRNRLIQNQYNALNKIKTNPFILNVQFKLDQENHIFYEITDYLDENSLRAELKRKTFTIEEKINIVFNLISALKAAHEQNVFHRDINPENVFLAGGYACLGNFGKSYFADHQDEGYTVMPTINESNATPYHALELSLRDASRASDIYSLAILTYELFVDKVPIESPFELNRLGGKLPPNRKATHVKPGVPSWLDDFCDHTILTDPDDRWDNLEEMEAFIKKATKVEEASSGSVLPKPDNCDFEIGSKVSDFTIYQHLGQGGYSQVYRVKHNLQSKSDFAMKVFNESVHGSSVTDEYNALTNLNHDNIVKFRWNGILPSGQFYTLMELLEGENLKEYAKGAKNLPVYKIFQVAKDILSALTYMQAISPPIYHRDIKPQNIVWDKGKRFVLIDFNVASVVENNLDYVGTNPYLAPDLVMGNNRVNWDGSADTFALGITLYELACKVYPWSGSMKMPQVGKPADSPQIHNAKLSNAFSAFLSKSIATKREARFQSAKEMLDELLTIGEHNLLQIEMETSSVSLVASGGSDQNIVNYINSLYSQSRHGNVGTRAGDKNSLYDSLTYTETKLDKQLIPDILDGRYRLVIITGNAGDGKTAFIRKIESKANNVKKLINGNGVTFEINGTIFQSNYDGSQDEDQKANDDVLSAFFKPFENLTDYSLATQGRIIAINEGRLVEFLHTVAPYRQLADTIENYFYTEGKSQLPDGLLIINLNLRSVVANGHNQESLFKQQVKLLTQKPLWANCQTCPVAENCFIKYNVASLNDSAVGNEIIDRMEWLLRTVSLKRELHITMRDLRSFIAFTLTRDYQCSEIKHQIEVGDEDYLNWWKHYYFNISDNAANDSAQYDRLIKLVRETDVAETAVPSLDRDLYFGTHLPEQFLYFEERKEQLLSQFNEFKIKIPLHDQTEEIQRRILTTQKILVRHQYFEGNINYRARLPYHSVFDFHDLLIGISANKEVMMNDTKQSIAKAISLNEGCNNEGIYSKNLVLSSAQVKDPISKSYRLFELASFELIINSSAHLTNYLEYEPDSLTFRSLTDKKVSLTISLDLFEMLYFISQGYSPSLNDIRGRFVELQIFKNLLENQEYKEVIVTSDNESFFSIKINDQYKLELQPLN
ncbi:methylation-associated defense system protein kinase MAD6 [Mucilaginibacter lappiensis]|uniref:methylation-associated defense system protein kinase MAD6 n=1 Tax=Mucilaginibacter lappiensis TaxID=354630 RepID=UPI003D2128B4